MMSPARPAAKQDTGVTALLHQSILFPRHRATRLPERDSDAFALRDLFEILIEDAADVGDVKWWAFTGTFRSAFIALANLDALRQRKNFRCANRDILSNTSFN